MFIAPAPFFRAFLLFVLSYFNLGSSWGSSSLHVLPHLQLLLLSFFSNNVFVVVLLLLSLLMLVLSFFYGGGGVFVECPGAVSGAADWIPLWIIVVAHAGALSGSNHVGTCREGFLAVPL